MEICDFINSTNEGYFKLKTLILIYYRPRDAVKAIKKRLQTQMGKNNATYIFFNF